VSVSQFDLVELLEEFTGVKLTFVLCPQTLNGVNAFCVGSAEKLHQFSGPVDSFLLNLHCLRFIRRNHVIHDPNVATQIDGDSVSRFDLAGLDRVLCLADLVGVDCSC
jgi:hypothetical protein